MKKTIESMSGKKTNTVVVIMIVYAWVGVFLNKEDPSHAVQVTLEALGLAGLRSGIKTAGKNTKAAKS